MRSLCLLFILILFSFGSSGASNDTISIYFKKGSTALAPDARHFIDSLMYYDVFTKGKKLGIIGYADYIGDERKNDTLSKARASAVEAYLIEMGIRRNDIETVTGKGEVLRTENGGLGYATDRKVAIVRGGFKNPVPPKLVEIANLKVNETAVLKNILFLAGTPMMLPGSKPALDMLLRSMRANPKLKIKIEGHACCKSDLKTGKYLDRATIDMNAFIEKNADEVSRMRAKAIVKYLLDSGIASYRLQYEGYGLSRPFLIDGKPATDDSLHRRVEARVLSK